MKFDEVKVNDKIYCKSENRVYTVIGKSEWTIYLQSRHGICRMYPKKEFEEISFKEHNKK